jgi:protein phosphatase 2C
MECSQSPSPFAAFGVHSAQGRRQYMQDTHTEDCSLDTGTSFFGVYDGHGGDSVAIHTATNLHKHIKEHLSQGASKPQALYAAYESTDNELMGHADEVGCTAVTVLIDTENIWIAHCGDARALLCKEGTCYRLTCDHKPETPVESQRIVETGGCVFFNEGITRVMGILAVSRAIGDHALRPYGVVAIPEVNHVARSDTDDFLLLASDGLFEVMTDEEATSLADSAVSKSLSKGANVHAAARIAAKVLVRIALCRGTTDNITVTVICMRQLIHR